MLVRMAVELALLGEDEDAPVRARDMHRRAVEGGKDPAVDHLVHGADRGMAAAEIEDLVDGRKDRIDLVGREQDGDAAFARNAADEIDDRLLVRGVEADERLVEDEKPRFAHHRLGDEDALTLASGQVEYRPLAEVLRPDAFQCRVHLAQARSGGKRPAPVCPGRRRDEIFARAQPDLPHRSDAAGACSRYGVRRAGPAVRAPRCGRQRG